MYHLTLISVIKKIHIYNIIEKNVQQLIELPYDIIISKEIGENNAFPKEYAYFKAKSFRFNGSVPFDMEILGDQAFVTVLAESIEEAEAMVKRGDYNTGDPIDGDFFEVTGIYETIEEKHE